MFKNIVLALGLIIIVLSACSGTNYKCGLSNKNDIYLPDTLNRGLKTVLWYSLNTDTTIVIDICRSRDVDEEVVNIGINTDSLDKKIVP